MVGEVKFVAVVSKRSLERPFRQFKSVAFHFVIVMIDIVLFQRCFDEILLDYFSYPLAGRMESLAIDETVDRVQTLHDLAAALRAALPEDVALSVVIRADLTEATGLTADTVEELFDRVYVAPGVDGASALATLSDSYRTTPGRVVPMVYAATGEGSYAVVPAVQ